MGSDFYSPQQAARILSRSGKTITERRVRQMLQAGEIAGERLPSGRWQVEQGAVHELLEERRERNDPMTVPRNPDLSTDQASPEASLSGSESVRELLSRVEALSRELGRSEARLELTERTESSIREERDQLRKELEAEREERRRLQTRLDQLDKSQTPDDPSKTAPEAPESPGRGFEGYGPDQSPGDRERGLQAPIRAIRGIAARIFGRG